MKKNPSLKKHYCLSTDLVRFDKPRLVFADSEILEAYGLLLMTVFDPLPVGTDKLLTTYRRLLIGPELNPGEIIEEDDEDLGFFFLPDDKIMRSKDLSRYVMVSDTHGKVHECLDKLKKHGFQYGGDEDKLLISICFSADDSNVLIHSDAFHYTDYFYDYPSVDDIGPGEMLLLFELVRYTGKTVEFEPLLQDDEQTGHFCLRLKDWTARFLKDEIIYDANNYTECYDGEYAYSAGKTRVKMTRDEFMAKHPGIRSI